MNLADIHAGDRVELEPWTDTWMMGDRYGTVRSVGRKLVQVHMDRSNKVKAIHHTKIATSERPTP